MYDLRAKNLASLTEHLHDACFNQCGKRDDVPFMTVQEGLCYRNCVTKFSVWYPTLGENIKDSATMHNNRRIEEIENKRSGATTDPWEKARDRLLEQAAQKQAF